MEFPRLVYKNGGHHQRKGGTFDYRSAEDADAHARLLDEGWSDSLEEAIAPKPADDDTKPPTRDELEQKANELGLKFDGRVSNKKLGEMIAAALKPKE